MSAREVIAKTLATYWDMPDELAAEDVEKALDHAGYVILSPDEVWAIRDEALEDAASLIEQHGITYGDTNALSPRIDGDRSGLEYTSDIRSLKGNRDG